MKLTKRIICKYIFGKGPRIKRGAIQFHWFIWAEGNINKQQNKLNRKFESQKESLKSDAQQFHQYLKWTISSHLKLLNIENTTTYDVGNPSPGLGQPQKCGSAKLVYVIPTLPPKVLS